MLRITPDISLVTRAESAACALQPIRMQLLRELGTPDSATGLARRLGLKRQQVNYHLKELEREGLVELHREVRRRNCTEQIMRRTARTILISPEVLGISESDRAAMPLQDRFSASWLAAAALEVVRKVTRLMTGAEKAGKRLATLGLNVPIRFASQRAQRAFAEELTEAVAALAKKYHAGARSGGRDFELFVACHPKLKEDTDG